MAAARQQRFEGAGCGCIDRSCSAPAEPRHLGEGRRRGGIVALLEEEAPDPHHPELTGEGAQRIDMFLHGVADVNEGGDTALLRRPADMAQHAFDLRQTTLTAADLL